MASRSHRKGQDGRTNKLPINSYEVGYRKPPGHGKIKKGEVRNPYGRNGKPKNSKDAFEKAMARKSRVTIDGEVTLLTTEEAYFMKVAALALSGNIGAARIVQEELHKRSKSKPEIPTHAELVKAEAENVRKRELSAKLVQLLEEKADEKKRGGA